MGWPWAASRCPPSCSLSLPCLSRAGGKNRMKKLMGQQKDRGSLTNYSHRKNRLNLEKINLFPIKIDLDSEKQRQN